MKPTYSFAAKLRDLVGQIAVSCIERLLLPPVPATVTSLLSDRKAMVLFAGETIPVPVSLGVWSPRVGSIVLVTGIPGARYVSDILVGAFGIGNSTAIPLGLLSPPGPPGRPGRDGDPGPDGNPGTDSLIDGPTGGARVDVFTTGVSTWTRPAIGTMVKMIAIGGGGGGGSGQLGVGSPQLFSGSGGGGGGGGALTWGDFFASSLPSTLTVVVGNGGTGAAGITAGAGTLPVNGGPGTDGQPSTVFKSGGLLYVNAGGGSRGGNTTGNQGGAGGIGRMNGSNGGTQVFATGFQGNGGAGAAGVVPGSGTPEGAGQNSAKAWPGGNFAAGGAIGTAGAAGSTSTHLANTIGTWNAGGGGGGSSVTGNAGAGGAGGIPGGGGGGGGAAIRNVGTSGAGGAGGKGIVVIITYVHP